MKSDTVVITDFTPKHKCPWNIKGLTRGCRYGTQNNLGHHGSSKCPVEEHNAQAGTGGTVQKTNLRYVGEAVREVGKALAELLAVLVVLTGSLIALVGGITIFHYFLHN